MRVLRCAGGGAVAVPSRQALGSPDLDSRPARTFFITLCTIRSPLYRTLVLARAVHHDAVPWVVLTERIGDTHVGALPRASLCVVRPRMPISRRVGSSSVERLDAVCPSCPDGNVMFCSVLFCAAALFCSVLFCSVLLTVCAGVKLGCASHDAECNADVRAECAQRSLRSTRLSCRRSWAAWSSWRAVA